MATKPRRPAGDWEAVVYDLDGTLVDLAVDWDAVMADVSATLADHGIDADGDLGELLERANEAGVGERVERVIADHEREGARNSTYLSLADGIADDSRPVGVCSLNCEAACRIALETHGLDAAVGGVIGRDSLDTYKPDPEPLLTTIEKLGVSPERTVFIGDTDRDAITAERAGTGFRWARDVL